MNSNEKANLSLSRAQQLKERGSRLSESKKKILTGMKSSELISKRKEKIKTF